MKNIDIVAISDTHGILPKIPECDILCICGDFSPLEMQRDYLQMWEWLTNTFIEWIKDLPCNKVFLTPGNHDFWFERYTKLRKIDLQKFFLDLTDSKLVVLIDQEYIYQDTYYDNDTNENKEINLKIYGTPYCNYCGNWAFMIPDFKSNEIYKSISDNVDILLTHDSPNIENIGVSLEHENKINFGNECLAKAITDKNPKWVFCGHVHSGSHTPIKVKDTSIVNCSILNENYKEAYKPFKVSI